MGLHQAHDMSLTIKMYITVAIQRQGLSMPILSTGTYGIIAQFSSNNFQAKQILELCLNIKATEKQRCEGVLKSSLFSKNIDQRNQERRSTIAT
ncbi:susD family protein [Sesbania bispinosa]|nr:susD family protein [Sesbania bispinosa]